MSNLIRQIKASFIPNIPAGNITSANIQSALNELDNKKASLMQLASTLGPTVMLFDATLNYAVGTIGAVLKTRVDVTMFPWLAKGDWNASTGIGTDNTLAIAAATATGAPIYFPDGKYLTTAPVRNTHSRQRFYGETKGPATTGGAVLVANTDFEQIQITGHYVTVEGLCLFNSVANPTKNHIQTYSVEHFQAINVFFDAIDSTGAGSGLGLGDGQGGIGGSMAIVDRCVFNHASIDVKTPDVHIINSWVWANSKTYGIRAVGSVVNLTITNTDVVPPRADVVGAKAGIYLSGPVTQPMINGVYIDGNPILNLGIGILAENGVLGLTINGGRANECDSDIIVLDSIIAPVIKGFSFFDGNKQGNRASDIVLRQTFSQTLEKPLVDGCSHIQSGAVSGTPGYAIKLAAGTARNGVRIINNSIHQPGAGGGYQDIEIGLMDGAFTSDAQGTLRGNKGTRTVYSASGSSAFGAADAFANFSFGVFALAYVPRYDQINLAFVTNTSVPFRLQGATVGNVGVGFTAGGVGTIYGRVEL